MRSRAKAWLINASKAHAKTDVIRCSRIIQYLASHTSSNPTSGRQPSGSINASQPIPLGPNAQHTAPMQSPPVDLGSAQGSQLSPPRTPRPGPVPPPLVKHTADRLPRAPQPFPLDVQSASPPILQHPTPSRPKSPPRPVRRTPTASFSAVSKTASTSLPKSPTTPIHQPLRSNRTSSHVRTPSSQPPPFANEPSVHVVPSHQRTSPPTPKASEVAPAHDPLGSNEGKVTQAEPFPDDATGAVNSQNAGDHKPDLS